MIASLRCYQKISWSLMCTFRHDRQDRYACNNGMHASMPLSGKLQCVRQSEEHFPRQQRTETLHALSTFIKMAYK